MSEDPKKNEELVPAPGRWVKGQSGNPNGRNGRHEKLIRLCQVKSIKMANIVEEIALTAKSPFARLQAVDMLWSRGFGKPTETVDVNANVSSSSTWSELAARAQKAIDAKKTITVEVKEAELVE